jgi:TolB-like protein
MPLTPGTRLGPYEILAPLGAGGMGEVYRATDTKLGRDIALKVLPAEMAHDPERLARFRREAKALAQLDHPNIVTIHSVEECDGVHFLTMQLVEGQPLDRLIPASGLSVEQIVEIASALGDALAAAHEKGIIHRDLKPANVMVSNEGRVKVLDFGLAKDVRAANPGDATLTSASQTQVGVVMGTPAYMSPEQTSGRPLDHRTDIFSLGVVLHEMATGRRPFEGNSSAELVSAILRDTAPSVADVRPDLPSDLARIIRRCLEKDPRHRVQTARDVSNEFRDLARQTSQKLAPTTATTPTSRAVPTADSGAARAEEGFWVAVLPFKYSGGNADLTALAEGLTVDIITGLSRFSYLRVIARSSTARYAHDAVDVRSAGKELGARYVMEGSLRQAGTKLRLAVQLVDAVSSAHLWAENYERAFSPEDIFALQDDLVPRIVSTVADQHGVLPHSMSNLIRNKSDEQLSPYEAVLRVFSFHERMSPEEHASVRALLEHTVQNAPGAGDCWAMLATIYCDEYMFGFTGQPDPLERSQTAARRAIEIEPSNWLACQALAQSLFFRRDLQAFRPVAERTIALNRMDGAACAFIGMLLALAGEWERGCEVVDAAIQLNPHHPGWYWLSTVFNAYRKHDYRASVDAALRINMPGYFWGSATSAAAFGQLGERERAQNAVKELLAIRPDFAASAREEFGKWFDDELVEHYVEGLRKAGLEIGGTAGNSFAAKASDSGAVRAEEGFWVAVLPFKYSGGNADLTALADGLSEDVVTGLSRFSYLRVIARGSTLHYANQATDLRTVGKELGARYVMEGSLRQAGIKLRLAVQLVDTVSGAHLWAESYERTFSPETVFALQDDLVPRIVSTVADMHGVLPRSMSEVVRSKASDQLSPYEAFLRSIDFNYRVTPEEHAAARTCMERAVQQAPGYADGWAMLSGLYAEEYGMEYNVLPDSVGRALHAAQRAVDAAPLNALAHQALARALFFRKEFQAFRTAAELAIELNPMSASTLCAMGTLIAYVGDWEHGCALVERAMQLLPRHPGWYLFPLFHKAYRNGDYRGAVSVGLKFNIPDFFATHLFMAAAYAQLGERDAAGKELRDLLRVRPGIAVWAREGLRRYHDRELVEHYIDGLRKAGLEITSEQSSAPTTIPT